MILSSRPKLSDLYTLSQSKLLENHTLHSGTYLYSPYMAVNPPPPHRLEVIKGTQKYERMIWEKGAVAVSFFFPVSSHFIFVSPLSCTPNYLEACNRLGIRQCYVLLISLKMECIGIYLEYMHPRNMGTFAQLYYILNPFWVTHSKLTLT